MTIFVYELVDPATDNCFYVGITENVQQRYRAHVAGCCVSTEGKIARLKAAGRLPGLNVFEEFPTREQALAFEWAIVGLSIRFRIPLCNNRYGRSPRAGKWNHGRKWSPDDKARVLALHRSGSPPKEIARALKRSLSSIKHAIERIDAINSR